MTALDGFWPYVGLLFLQAVACLAIALAVIAAMGRLRR